MDFAGAFKRPFTDAKKFLLGCLLQLIPPLALGYDLKCALTAFKGNEELPEWAKLPDLFFDGLNGFVIAFFFVIPSLLVFLGVFFFTARRQFDALISSFANPFVVVELISFSLVFESFFFMVGLMVSFILFLVGCYLFPLGLVGFTVEKKFSSAFDLNKVFLKSLSFSYLFSFVLVCLVFLVFVVLFLSLFSDPNLFYVGVGGLLVSFFVFDCVFFTRIGSIYDSL